ncbi:MAG: translation elongation factor 4 [Kiritimatiellae bacterium]|jgi:GTP-binding protein LepA|nr:translation elongation factor 4 [Kiritimatiellia bacterium]
MTDLSRIRNFCVIAHIDHGKSTLADRMMQLTHTVEDRKFRDQLLDDMDLERERGITIKSHPVTMKYTAKDGIDYTFNLIDTPGHVDFTYEVSRSMAACEGAILVVDAAQGVEAQTVANTYLAIDNDLVIIPVLNKVDLPNADVDGTIKQIEDVLGIEVVEPLLVSAKTGEGVEDVMDAITRYIPAPETSSDSNAPCKALIFDSIYDAFRGVVTDVRVFDGELKKGDRIQLMRSNVQTEVKEIGRFMPEPVACDKLSPGDVGYIIGTIKAAAGVQIGDTITHVKNPADKPLAGFKEVTPMVFCGLYPVDTSEYDKFRQSLEKLSLNDAAFSFHPENSVALGFGFRCGYLGLLHMEVIEERLRREFEVNIISTSPSVIYKICDKRGNKYDIDNPIDLPEPTQVEYIEEPMIKAFIICMSENIGDIMRLIMDRRGEVTHTDSLDANRVMLTASMPLNEILTDFHDYLKSVSHGYASMDYEYDGYVQSDIVKLDIMLNGEPVDAFSTLVHRTKAEYRGRLTCKALRDAIPRHMFPIPVQATLGSKIIARETIRAFRKDVTAKLYGGDITRKRKLLEKQKAGKKRMKQFGKVNVPQEAFVSVLKKKDDS